MIDYRKHAIENAEVMKPTDSTQNKYIADDWPKKGESIAIMISTGSEVGEFRGRFDGFVYIDEKCFIKLGNSAFAMDKIVGICVEVDPKLSGENNG